MNQRTEHYFTEQPRVASRPATAHLKLPDVELDLLSDRGVFAYGRVDHGTELLLRTVPPPPSQGDLLDLGAGYGAIAMVIARRSPAARVWAVDVNTRALQLCRLNAEAASLTNVVAKPPADVPESVRFSAIYSNPPVRIGKEPLHALLSDWLARLTDDGRAYLVLQRNLGSDSLARRLQDIGYHVQRLRSRSGYRVLEITAADSKPAMIAP